MITVEERHKGLDDKIWSMQVALTKATNGKETLKITLKASELEGGGGQPNSSK
jgi:hypothetical protein